MCWGIGRGRVGALSTLLQCPFCTYIRVVSIIAWLAVTILSCMMSWHALLNASLKCYGYDDFACLFVLIGYPFQQRFASSASVGYNLSVA